MKKLLAIIVVSLGLTACVSDPLARLKAIRISMLPQVNQQVKAAKLEPGAHAYIRIFKEEATLETWLRDDRSGRYQLYKTFPICTYSGLLGPKLREGDHQSPEGFYDITEDRLWPQSIYHLAMNIGFPNEYDQARGRTGTYLMIHGGCKSEGCYAMTDQSIEEIYLLVEQSLQNNPNVPVPVHIFPFRMTRKNLNNYKGAPWDDFWVALRPAYTAFEKYRVPPDVKVRYGHYVVTPQTFVKRAQG